MKAVKYNRRIERGIHKNGKESLIFFNAFIDLIEHLSVEVNDINSSNNNVVDLRLERMFSGQQSLRGIKDPELANKLLQLKNAALLAFDNIRKSGKEEGKNLLIALQKGDITFKEINESA